MMNVFAPAFALLLLCTGTGVSSNLMPEFLTYDDLTVLSATAVPDGDLARKLNSLLSTPVVQNLAARSGAMPRRPNVTGIGPAVRVAFWNLEGGGRFQAIRSALHHPAGFRRTMLSKGTPDPNRVSAAEKQLQILEDVDILIATESDSGVSRSEYRNVAGELAAALDMNYAYGVEFVEVDPLLLGLEPPPQHDQGKGWNTFDKVDPTRFRGMHGNAVMSRYPIMNARILGLPQCYDWYSSEKKKIAQIEKGKRWAANKVFRERFSRQIRHGGRIALIVRLGIPELAEGTVTVVSVHLESRASTACRQRQIDALLDDLAAETGPVILAGDFNTNNTNAAPTSIRREVFRRVSSLKFWIDQGLRWAGPMSVARYGMIPLNTVKNLHDPTVLDLPILLSNGEAGLFRRVERFRFDDGGAFDFSGTPERSGNGRWKTLANSNQRSGKGFVPTFRLERTYGGVIGEYKIDWFFIKPAKSRPNAAVPALAPHFPVTMTELNEIGDGRISDHAPMTVDLPLTER